jgi:competence protein ComEC
MSPDMISAVRGAGASHVIALSGMHLGVLAYLLSRVFSRIAVPRVRYIIIAAALLGYVWVAGWIPSLVRALILACVVLLSRDRDRALPPENVLSRCVLITALVAPGMVWALGFQLSLWALVGLFFLSPRLVERLSYVLPHPVAGYVGITLGPLIATAPVSLLVFGTVYPVGVLSAGVLALVAVILMWGSLACIMLVSVPGIGSLIVGGLDGVTRAFVLLSSAFAAVPSIHVTEGHGLISTAWWCTLLTVAVGAGGYLRRHRQRALYRYLESHGKPQFDF